MKTVSIFKNGNNRAIRLSPDLNFEGVREGNSLTIRPARPNWGAFSKLEKGGVDYMTVREEVISDQGLF